ncbi:Hypothetical protein precursor [Flavobacterium indicum GPTSA100-9 = DSM 17447]|uniref:Outer membrane protein beta-barrel domain-containing protein n=1 Tax=Flavobacterium indicum (strain DSM 17447 / CIP 109464 / GPTSA100-9) TaxID=1094466 RepID=H8XRU3_FLAIG|nr:Hypothetical protein precursor [Flavobacterium indicum GPTSA100-9 = DSM 17447]
MFNKKLIRFVLIFSLISITKSYSQENIFNRSSIKTGIGIGYNDSKEENGLGLIYNLGYQKSFGVKERFRINPNLIIGGFSTNLITDTRDQFYRITSLQMNVSYDVVRYNSISLLLCTGVFGNYSRGLLGTGGELQNNQNSEYFQKFYFGGSLGIGLRINPIKSRIAYEIKPFTIQLGNKGFSLGYIMMGLDIKFKN